MIKFQLTSPKIIYFLFFLSGAAGLIYEIVWGRLLVLIFGSTTNSIVAVIAAFLGGLAIGSLVFGKITDRLLPQNLIKTYSLLELGVGVTAFLTLFFLPIVKTIYAAFSDGSSVTLGLLIIKFGLAILILLIPTTLMGATLPVLVRFAQLQNKSLGKSVSYLYAANTFGAVIGVLLSAFILIELFGLRNTLLTAVTINILVASWARLVTFKSAKISQESKRTLQSNFSKVLSLRVVLIISAFSVSGLVSIAYEVLWTRILTPTLGTFIYAFAAILAIYLFGIALGSLIYEKMANLIRAKSAAFAFCQFGIGFFALGSVYLTSNQVAINKDLMVLLVILPATIFMGLTFPVIVSLIGGKGDSGKVVGLSYFANTAGSIIGGFLASFLFLPFIGSTQSVIFLSIINFIMASLFILGEKVSDNLRIRLVLPMLVLAIFTSWLFIAKRHSLYENTTQWRINWAKEKSIEFAFKEDEVASVFAYYDRANDDQNLFIDGVPTTGKIGETKLMAHIPILLHNNPQDVLVIAFGMGTTYRSSLSYNLKTDAVELVPSVPKLLYLFHPDAAAIHQNPKGRIIINDGRNYIFLTNKKYDIVTIDPPPPFNAAGTTVLYSKDFYREIAKKLKAGGIVSQWIWFGSREDDITMAIKSFIEVFPYVMAFQTPQGTGGIFLEGSFGPLEPDPAKLVQKQSLLKPKADLAEFYENSQFQLSQVLGLVIGDRQSLLKLVANYPAVTDDYPRTEYFILRHKFKKSASLVGEAGANFIDRLKSIFSLTIPPQ